MKYLKHIMLVALTLILSISLTVQAEAATKKTAKPTLRIVNGTMILHQDKVKASQNVTYKLYSKYKGEWEMSGIRYSYQAGTEHIYQEVVADGSYAVTSTVDNLKESDKVLFTVKNTIKHKYASPFATESFMSPVYSSYKLYLGDDKTTKKKIVITGGYDKDLKIVKNYKVALYYVDAKGKLKSIGKKKLTKVKSGKQTLYEATFTPVKGQRDYAFAQINSKGKVLGYTHFSYDPSFKKIDYSHQGLPAKSMKYKASEWK